MVRTHNRRAPALSAVVLTLAAVFVNVPWAVRHERHHASDARLSLYERRQMPAAVAELQKAIALNPTQLAPRQMLAHALRSMGQRDAALREYEQMEKVGGPDLAERVPDYVFAARMEAIRAAAKAGGGSSADPVDEAEAVPAGHSEGSWNWQTPPNARDSTRKRKPCIGKPWRGNRKTRSSSTILEIFCATRSALWKRESFTSALKNQPQHPVIMKNLKILETQEHTLKTRVGQFKPPSKMLYVARAFLTENRPKNRPTMLKVGSV